MTALRGTTRHRAGFFALRATSGETVSVAGGKQMAARLRKTHQDDIRLKIKTSQLVNVLQDHALNEGGEIAPSRMKAIEILLRKSLADLSAVTVSGDPDNPLEVVGMTKEQRDASVAAAARADT